MKMGPVIFILFFPAMIQCYPITTPLELPVKPDVREENVFPNGTVAGKYSYMDKEGNPVQVKYYADGANYGVELKSLKVLDGDSQKVQYSKEAKIEYSTSDSSTGMPTNLDAVENQWPVEMNLPAVENKLKIPNDFLDDKKSMKSLFRDEKPGTYEMTRHVYPQTKNLRKDKAGSHWKPIRMVRKVSHFYKEPRMCEQLTQNI